MDRRTRVLVFAVLLLLPQLALTQWLVRARIEAFWTVPGSDYAVFWSGGTLAHEGRLVEAYDQPVFQEMFERNTGPVDPMFWLYPPSTALLAEPFTLLDYTRGCAVWLALGTLAVAAGAWAWGGGRAVAIALLWPGTVVAFAYVQATLLLSFFLVEGLRRAERQPWLAGALLGFLFWKPHWLAVPMLACALRGQWRVIAGAAGVSLALVAASIARYGIEPWRAFREHSGTAMTWIRIMDRGDVVSAYAAAPEALAGLAQGLVTVASLAAVWVVSRWPADADHRTATIVLATTTLSPYLHFYDLVVLYLPAVLVAERLRARGEPVLPFLALAGAVLWACRVLGAVFAVQPWSLIGLAALGGVVWTARGAAAAEPRTA